MKAIPAFKTSPIGELPRIVGSFNADAAPKSRSYPVYPRRSSKRSEEHTSELQSHSDLVCRLLLEKKKQASVVTQINRAMSQLDQVTQRNASAAEELSSTAQEINSQAMSLQYAMSLFMIRRNAGES